jgi:hypothetical protein
VGGRVLVGGGGGMEEMRVRDYTKWTSYIYMKYNKETSCDCFKWGEEEIEETNDGDYVTNVQYKPNWNCHYESPPV